MSERLKALAEAGVSIWFDDLSRERLETGNLADLVKNRAVTGVTTNPTIFASALAQGERYDEQVRRLAAPRHQHRRRRPRADHRRRPTRLRRADRHLDRHRRRRRPGLHRGAPGARVRHRRHGRRRPEDCGSAVERPNLLVKVPATTEGAPAISTLLGEGINVNVTLIFGIDRYRGRDGRLPGGPREGPGQRARPAHDPLRRVLLRLPRGHRGRQAARRARPRGRGGPQGPGRDRQRTPGLPGVRGGLQQRPLHGSCAGTAPASSGRCGRRRA